MSVARILQGKGRHVITTRGNASLQDVVDVLAVERVGALPVMDKDGRLVGIISERDIVRVIAQQGSGALDRFVSEHMTRDVVTGDLDRSIVDVLRTMTCGRFRHMPIVEAGLLVGIVSSGDAIKYRFSQMETEQSALREYIATA